MDNLQRLFILMFLALLCVFGEVVVQNRKLFVDGQEFFVKGVVYAPPSIGYGLKELDYFTSAFSDLWERDISIICEDLGANTIFAEFW